MSKAFTQNEKESLAKLLFDIGVIQFGEFKLVSGITSPLYINMKGLISHPQALRQFVSFYNRLLEPLKYDRLAGVAYGALPIAGAISLEIDRPWIYARKEIKKYGMGKQIEGEWSPGETVVVIDDLISKGDSKFQSIELFEREGMKVKDVVVLVDRELGGAATLANRGYALHSAITVTEILNCLKGGGQISHEQFDTVMQFMKEATSA